MLDDESWKLFVESWKVFLVLRNIQWTPGAEGINPLSMLRFMQFLSG